MASTPEAQEQQPSFTRDSPSPKLSPRPAMGTAACPRSFSDTTTTSSVFSESMGRESIGSTTSSNGTSISRSSSASYTTRQSLGGLEKPNRRGYVRPQGTNFAASAQSRESVLSLGSIAHLQYYFARTGLLDGKGGRLARKKNARGTLDLSALDTSFLTPRIVSSDHDSSYASMGSSPELAAHTFGEMLVESPTQEDFEYTSDDEEHPHMLPPTVSTYNHREKPIPRPPTLEELKSELLRSLSEADKVLEQVAEEEVPVTPPRSNTIGHAPTSPPAKDSHQGWHEVQGMHILDIITLAIRAAKMYYTAHDQPARLSAIKSERRIRAELLSVMEVLKRMATRNFASGMRAEERATMKSWVAGVYDMLKQEEIMEETERKQRESWAWLADPWEGTEVEREYEFLKSMDPEINTLPLFHSVDDITDDQLPSEFLNEMKTGLRLVKLHNAIVRKSKRPFGAIDKWHTDFGKPYRSADNLRFWVKAAELRWEIVLKFDVMAIANGTTDRAVWKAFEDAIWKWCGKVRQEISGELKA